MAGERGETVARMLRRMVLVQAYMGMSGHVCLQYEYIFVISS
jgi:hypothetical protein